MGLLTMTIVLTPRPELDKRPEAVRPLQAKLLDFQRAYVEVTLSSR